MTLNMGAGDRVIRALVAIGIAALYVNGRINGTTALVLGIVAIVFLVTSSIGVCPAYLPFGISSRKK